MLPSADPYTATMSPQQAAWFSAEYNSVRKDEMMGALLAFFLGTFGAHHFYLGRNRLGILYAVFFWTGVPTICGVVECFLMPGRVRAFNFAQATEIAARVSGLAPAQTSAPVPVSSTCHRCHQPLDASAAFCTRCGTPLSAAPTPSASTEVNGCTTA